MIGELKQILDMIGDVTGIALWILGGYLAFQLVIYLSTAGMLYKGFCLLINKAHNYAVKPTTVALELPKLRDRTNDVLCHVITSDDLYERMTTQLYKLRGKNVGINTQYIHEGGIMWLEEAFREKEERDNQKDVK